MSKVKFNGTTEEFKILKEKLNNLKQLTEELTPHIQAVRDLYKHWNGDTRSTSEDLIVSWNNQDGAQYFIELVEELEAFMEDDSEDENES